MNLLFTFLLSLVNFILPKLMADKIHKRLYSDHHNIYVRIKDPEYTFIYRSPIYDDLNMLCKENLINWEFNSRKIFLEFAKISSVIFDIGAYSGIYSLIAGKTSKNAKIFSFEPNPNLFKSLEKNIKLNMLQKKCIALNYALSDKKGTAKFFQNHEIYTSQFSLIAHKLNTKSIWVPTSTINDFVAEYKLGTLDLIKIDVEGYEEFVILGGLQTIRQFSPIFLMEALSSKELKAQTDNLRPLGYSKPIQILGNEYDSRNFLWIPHNKLDSLNVKIILKNNRQNLLLQTCHLS